MEIDADQCNICGNICAQSAMTRDTSADDDFFVVYAWNHNIKLRIPFDCPLSRLIMQ